MHRINYSLFPRRRSPSPSTEQEQNRHRGRPRSFLPTQLDPNQAASQPLEQSRRRRHLQSTSSHNIHPKPRRVVESAALQLPWARILPYDRAAFQHDDSECSICCQRLIDGLTITRLPCGHLYHFSCCLTWLVRNNSCPDCRYELATKNAHREQSRLERMKERTTVQCNCKLPQVHRCFFVDETRTLHEQLQTANHAKVNA